MFFSKFFKKKANELESIVIYGKEKNSYEQMKKRAERLIRLFKI